MAEPLHLERPVAGGGITVAPANIRAVASLRYFSGDGDFARAVAAATGAPLPSPRGAHVTQGAASGLILAWRSPTETLCFATDPAALAALAVRLADATDGCVVELTGGVGLLRVTGSEGGAELLARLGDARVAPRPGESHRGRLADVPVLAVSVRPGEVLLAVDRALAPHLVGWIRATLADLGPG